MSVMFRDVPDTIFLSSAKINNAGQILSSIHMKWFIGEID
jgi:hypothetical protein